MPILPVLKGQSATQADRPLKTIVDYSMSGQSVGAYLVSGCTPIFVFAWDVEGIQPFSTETLRRQN